MYNYNLIFKKIIREEKRAYRVKRILGRNHLWVTLHNYYGWRLQQNVYTGKARIIDSRGISQISGTIDRMYQVLDKMVEALGRHKEWTFE